MKRKRWLILSAIVFVGIQFIRIDKTSPEVQPGADFIAMTNPPAEIAGIIKASCYDCHSHQVRYPWYAEIAPISWYIKHHVNEGLGRVNFSNWDAYPDKKAARKLEACAETVELENMPLGSYTLLHKEAKLTNEQRKKLSEWLLEQAETIND